MNKEVLKKFIISVVVLVLLIAALTLSALYDVNIGPLKILSVNTLISQYKEISTASTNLEQQKSRYQSTLNSLETTESDFKNQKAKYESISDDTISMIKQATTDEKYNIEYIWVKLGNYAKENNLAIILVEPGGTSTTTAPQNTESTNTQSGSTKSTQTTTTNNNSNTTNNNTSTNNNSTTQSGNVPTKQAEPDQQTIKSSDVSTSSDTSSSKDNSSNSTDSKTTNSQKSNTPTDKTETNKLQGVSTTPSSSGDTLKIQVTGNYLDVSGFIFDIENDSELRFKLDNISMEYVGSNNIRASFSIKNMTIIK